MSKVSYILRAANAANLHPVSVRHSHKANTWEKATGVTVAAANIDLATGRISNQPDAPELTEQVAVIRHRLDRALRRLAADKTEPTRQAVEASYKTELKLKEQLAHINTTLNRKYGNVLESLRAELVSLEAQVAEKKAEIEAIELRLGVNSKHLVTSYLTGYAEGKKGICAVSTYNLFYTVSKLTAAFNPLWDMREVNSVTLREFERFLIKQGKSNLTITDTLTKVKTVCFANAKQLQLDTTDIRDFKPDVKRKRNPNPIFLKKEELQELIDLPLIEEHEQRIRDRFVLMCLVGVRFSDSAISPDLILNDELLFSTTKTDTDVTVRLSGITRSILERYGYTLPTIDLAYFNRQLKRIVSRLPSLQYRITVKSYNGANKPTKTAVYKWEKISSHVARRTFINLALARGVNPVSIAAVVGHNGTDLIMKTYGNADAGKELLAQIMD